MVKASLRPALLLVPLALAAGCSDGNCVLAVGDGSVSGVPSRSATFDFGAARMGTACARPSR